MKNLTKDKVYVLIDNQPDCDRAIEILTNAGEPMWKDSTAFLLKEDKRYLKTYKDMDWGLSYDNEYRISVTLDELERILMPKKQLTKEDLPIGTKVVPHDKTVKGCVNFNECDCWNTDKAQEQGFLYVSGYTTDGELKLNEYPNRTQGNFYKDSDVTLYIKQPKIKKAELLERIEDLEENVLNLGNLLKDLTEKTNKVTIVHPAEFVGDSMKEFKVVFGDIGKGTVEIKEEKPAFEVGKVYKGENAIMFYCTKVKYGRPYGFGFSLANDWMEDDDEYWDDYFTEATPEEWFSRLEEEAKKRGYKDGVKVMPLWVTPKDYWEVLTNTITSRFENGAFYLSCCVMNNGKWAEIIEEPQYQAGTLGAFWDGDFDFALSKRCVWLGKLENQTKSGQFVMQETNMCYQNFKPLKFD